MIHTTLNWLTFELVAIRTQTNKPQKSHNLFDLAHALMSKPRLPNLEFVLPICCEIIHFINDTVQYPSITAYDHGSFALFDNLNQVYFTMHVHTYTDFASGAITYTVHNIVYIICPIVYVVVFYEHVCTERSCFYSHYIYVDCDRGVVLEL